VDPPFRDPALAVELAQRAVQAAPKEGLYWKTLGVARYRADDWKGAVTAVEKSMELRRGGDAADGFVLAMAHWQLGEKDRARQWYDKAAASMEKNQPKNQGLIRFRAEADELLGMRQK
jgi:uncharacterized protein HemY